MIFFLLLFAGATEIEKELAAVITFLLYKFCYEFCIGWCTIFIVIISMLSNFASWHL